MLRVLPPMIEPDRWTLAFHRTSPWWWVRLLAVGRHKHVSAFAWVQPYGMWVYYNITLFGTKIVLLPDSQQATAWLLAQTADADLVRMPRLPVGRENRHRPPITVFSCVSALKHLLGIRCGALPISFYRACLRAGGQRIGASGESVLADRADRSNPKAVQL